MKNLVLSVCVSSLIAFSSGATAGSSGQPAQQAPEATPLSAVLNRDAASGEIALRLAPIRSLSDLHAYVAAHAKQRTPLDVLSPVARRVFLDSLSFNAKGLTSFNRAVLEDELTASQAYEVLSLFGVQRLTPMLHRARVETATDRLITSPRMAPQGSCGINTPTQGTGCDHDGYRCMSHGTCTKSMDMICTSNC